MKSESEELSRFHQLTLWLFTFSFIAITFVPRSLDNVMFMDGTTYASIARNMAIGKGSFWRPYFSDSFWLPYDNDVFFHGHPPLQFGIQSLFFTVLGDSTAVENIYNLFILVLSVTLIALIWRKLFKHKPAYAAHAWLPVLAWYGIVFVWYGIPNNFLDSTMAVFCLLSCYLQLLALKAHSPTQKNMLFSSAGISIVMALLTKGPVGLYPLSFTLIYLVVFDIKKIKKAIWATFLILLTILLSFSALMLYKPASEFLSVYFDGQIIQSLLQKRERVTDGWRAHFYLLSQLVYGLRPHFLLIALLYGISLAFKLRMKNAPDVVQTILFMLLIALSGILPMLISVKQFSHYLLPALPFVALCTAAVMIEKTAQLLTLVKNFSVIPLTIAIGVCWLVMFRKIKNPEANPVVANIKTIQKYIPHSSTLGICPNLLPIADLHAYFQRYHRLSLSTDMQSMNYILSKDDCSNVFDPAVYNKIALEDNFFLFSKKPAVSFSLQ